jgi:hypothetical protein
MQPSLIYYGPTIKSVGLYQNYQYEGGILSPEAEALIERYPGFKGLFIDPSKLAETAKGLKQSGSAQSQLFRHFQKLLVK